MLIALLKKAVFLLTLNDAKDIALLRHPDLTIEMKSIPLLLCILVIGLLPLGAQPDPNRPSEEDVSREKLFIEANREKLLGNLDKAIGILRELHRQDNKNPAIAFELGRLLDAEEDTEEAIRFLQLATDLDSSNEWYAKTLANVYQREGRNKEGAKLYEKLVKVDPDDDYLYFRWAYFLVRAQEVDQALEVYEDLEKRTGLTTEIAQRRHTLFMGIGDNKRAAKALEELIEVQPNVLTHKHQLASFYESRGEQDKALALYQEIARINPGDPKAQIALAGGSNVQRDELRYLTELKEAFGRSDVAIDLKISKLLPFINKVAETGDIELADAALELTALMEDVHSDEAKSFSAAGDLLYYSNRRDKAIAKYRQTLDRDASVFAVWQQLLKSIHELRNYEQLFESANDALDVFPNRASVQYYLALGADGLERYDDALDALSLADLMAGRDQGLRGEIKALEGQVYQHKGEEKAADEAFDAARDLNKTSAEVAFRYSQYLLSKSDVKNAKSNARAAAEANPYNPHYTHGYAHILYLDKAYNDADEQVQAALRQGANNWANALELAGDIKAQLKDLDQAVHYWQQAKAIAPSPTLDNKIANRSL